MDNTMRMRLGSPFLIGIYSLALLSIGAAIGARWAHSPHTAAWMVLLGAVLMVVHDVLTGAIMFFVSAAWASRISRQRESSTTNTREEDARSKSQRRPRG
jgi:uncharacterized membrane protein YhaH (DUF805 family)